MKARKSDLVAMGFLIAALILFGLYQVMPFSYILTGPDWSVTHGFEHWGEIWGFRMNPGDLLGEDGLVGAGILLGTFLVVTSPFLVGSLTKSRMLWWLFTMASVMVMCGLTGYLGWSFSTDNPNSDSYRLGSGCLCLIGFPVLHFIGLLCTRSRSREMCIG